MFFYLIGRAKLIGPFHSSDEAWKHWQFHYQKDHSEWVLLTATLPKDM